MLNQKNYVKLSVCKSNIKKEATYYARVCKKGKVSKEGLIKKVKEKAPYIDIHSFEVGLEILVESILECVEEGLDVDLLGLGTVGLKSKGSLCVNKNMEKVLENEINKSIERAEKSDSNIVAKDGLEGSYEKELAQIAKKKVEFTVQFSPSRVVKKHIKEHVEPSLITAKVRHPKIKSIEKVYAGERNGEGERDLSIIKIKGEDLKVVGESSTLYIKTQDKILEIPKEAIILNEPKTLMFITDLPLKDNEKYSIHLSTQYAKMGNRETSLIRRCVKEFSFESEMVRGAKKAG